MATHVKTKIQETKKKQKAEQEEQAIEAELNMDVMENWLNITKFNEEQQVLSRKAEGKYNALMSRLSMPSEQVGPFSEEEEKERKMIIDDYRRYCIRTYGKYGEEIRPPKKQMDTFHQGDQPSQFMFDFIEATHSLFQTQQKRIDELETVVAELSAKIQ